MKNLNHKNTHIFGIGNSARQDDGLGWAFLDELQKKEKFQGEIHYCYQLNIEDAEIVADADKVIFVDACEDNIKEGYKIEKCQPDGKITYTTHALDPEAILALCNEVYGKIPEAYVLKIKGYNWELDEKLSESARKNLQGALSLVSEFL